jgi:hypothetical protein
MQRKQNGVHWSFIETTAAFLPRSWQKRNNAATEDKLKGKRNQKKRIKTKKIQTPKKSFICTFWRSTKSTYHKFSVGSRSGILSVNFFFIHPFKENDNFT